MATRQLSLTFDATQPSLTIDLDPQFFEMELNFTEIDVAQLDNVSIGINITESGGAFDLTGYSVLFRAKASIDDSSYVFSKAGTVDDATNGHCIVALSGSDLADDGTLVAQLYLSLNGATTSVAQFPLIINKSV